MAKARTGLLAGCLLVWCGAGAALAAPPAAQMLEFQPHQQGIVCSTPSAQEQPNCKVELIQGSKPGSTGWLLRDPQGRPLRQFFDTNGDRRVDVLSFYLDGVEVYREIDSQFSGRVDQFRWFNSAGMRWGTSSDTEGKYRITFWKIISAEEASQEALQAVVTHDLERLKALWISEDELKSLGLPESEQARIRNILRQAPAKFQKTVNALSGLSEKTRWERLEAGAPQCVPAEPNSGMKQDLIRQPRAAVLYENNGKHDWLQIGEMIQVGQAWRLIDAPSSGDGAAENAAAQADPEVQKQLDALKALDAQAPRSSGTPGDNPEVARYNFQRAEIVQKIIAKARPEERDQWVRQLADCLSAAAQSSPKDDRTGYERLVQLAQQVVHDQPGSALAAFVTFREMSADYAAKMVNAGSDMAKVQEQWLGRLSKYVQDYPQSEDTPDALCQLGMGSEFVGNEIAAKKWYEQLTANYPSHALAAKAQGALRRLELEGKEMMLSGPTAGGETFNLANLRGKVVIVYYWASWNQQSVGDFARLKVLLNNYAAKGVELVCVNLDNAPPEAGATTERPPGVQLYQPNGLDSPLAVQYGVMVLPQMFLVGKDGKVVSRTVQIGTVEDEIKKQLK
jgi:hypothetical protein